MIFFRSLEEKAKRKLVLQKNKWYMALQLLLVFLWAVTFIPQTIPSLIEDFYSYGYIKEFFITFIVVNIIILIIIEIVYQVSSGKLSQSEIEAKKLEIINSPKTNKKLNEFLRKLFRNVGILLGIFLVIAVVLWITFFYINYTK